MNTVARRARVMLGTLVEVGIVHDGSASTHLPFDAAYDEIAITQAAMSRFETTSDLGRFHALPAGASLQVEACTAEVLHAAAWLQAETQGLFDVSLGTGPQGWRCLGRTLTRLDDATRLDLGGIAKGHAVDLAVAALQARGCTAGWVNAGGDLRVFGELELPVVLRDERQGGVRHFGQLQHAAFATSHFGLGARANAHGRDGGALDAHVSVAAPRCLWADALTKVVAVSGQREHPLIHQLGAQAWLH